MIDPEGFAFARWVWVRRHMGVSYPYVFNQNWLWHWRNGWRTGYYTPGVA